MSKSKSNAHSINTGSAYEIKLEKEKEHTHILAVIVDNEPGALARVIGLFSGRGYNIEGLTVSTVNREHSVSRITIQTSGSAMVIEQIKAQLSRMVFVHDIHDLSIEGALICREIVLIKTTAKGNERLESLRLADIFGAQVVDTTLTSFIFQFSGKPQKIDALVELMKELGECEIVRSGVVAISRGDNILKF